MRLRNFFLLFIPFLLLTVACDRITDDPKGDEMARLDAWLLVNNVHVDSTTPEGLRYVNIQEGTGITPPDSSYVLFSYVKRDLDDVVYETSYQDVAELYGVFKPTTHYVPSFAQFIANATRLKGLSQGLSMMKEGGKARLILPSTISEITANRTYIYDIELKNVITDPNGYENDSLVSYLSRNPGFTSFSDSIYYKKTSTGTRQCIIAKDTVVSVNYTGKFLDGFVFDTNVKSVAQENGIYNTSKTYEPLTFAVGSYTIWGFSIAVTKMIEGEKATVIIPSKFGYGTAGSSGSATIILPYSTLVFDIEVTHVAKKGTVTN